MISTLVQPQVKGGGMGRPRKGTHNKFPAEIIETWTNRMCNAKHVLAMKERLPDKAKVCRSNAHN